MTVQLEAPTATATVLMTADEARRIIGRIKEGLENVRALLLDLYEGEGWRALGYESFLACAEAEFSASKSQAYRLLNAAQLDAILSPIGETGLPEAHLRELKPVVNEPETARAIVTRVRELKGQSMTADDVRSGVDEHLARPARAKATKSAVVRKSISSKAEAGDFADDAPEYAEQSQEAYGAAPNAEKWCPTCGGKYRGEACPCATAPAPMDGGSAEVEPEYPIVSEQPCTTCGGEILVLSEQDDRARGASINAAMADGRPIVQLCHACQIDDTAPADQPAAAEARYAERVVPSAAPEVEPAASTPVRQASGAATRPAPVGTTPHSYHPTVVDGKAPTPVYPTAEGFLNGVDSYLSGEALDEFKRLFDAHYREVQRKRELRGETVAAPVAAPDLREVLANRPAAEIVDAIAETSTMPRLTELVGLLAERLTRMRLRTAATTGAH